MKKAWCLLRILITAITWHLGLYAVPELNDPRFLKSIALRCSFDAEVHGGTAYPNEPPLSAGSANHSAQRQRIAYDEKSD